MRDITICGFSPGSSGGSCSTGISDSPRTTIWRSLAKYSGTIGMFSRWMYCHTSSSVQLDSGNTRIDLAFVDPGVVEVPQLGTLVLRIPLAERIAERVDPLLGARLLFVAPGAAERRVEARTSPSRPAGRASSGSRSTSACRA